MGGAQGRANKRAQWVLGTAQLGQPYGAANVTGLPSETEAVVVVQRAVAAGVSHIDTARAYGDAERRIGLALAGPPPALEIITKLSPLADVLPGASPETAVAAASASLEASCRALRRTRLDAVLLHRAEHLDAWGGAVWRFLREKKAAGVIGRLGASLQSPDQAERVLAEPHVGQVQLPFNVLDRRWEESGIVEGLRRRPEVVVHVRSVLLQGLLAGGREARWPQIPGFDKDALIIRIEESAASLGRSSPADLCLAFVRAQDWIDGIVIGMETPRQVESNAALLARPPLTPEQAEVLRAAMPRVPEALINPARWSEFAAPEP